MSFILHPDAKSWAKKIIGGKSPIKIDFDFYYMCFLVGIGHGTRINQTTKESFIRYYPDEYKKNRELYAAIILAYQFKTQSFRMDRAAVKKEIDNKLDDTEQTNLTKASLDVMNEYGFAGFQIIRDCLPKAPIDGTQFLIWYYREMVPKLFKES
tara:strand:+ start:149 stop:610 length:462 start_codon:yes stop_codon:yes gene_type:complete